LSLLADFARSLARSLQVRFQTVTMSNEAQGDVRSSKDIKDKELLDLFW
jgi:hypothetical protein